MKPETKQFLRQMLACLLCLLLGGGIALGAVWAWMGEDGRTLLSAQHLIAQRFVGDYDETEALHGTLGAMVEGLGDRWSYYLTPDEAKQVREDRENAYVGIGVTVNQEGEGGLEILTVTPGVRFADGDVGDQKRVTTPAKAKELGSDYIVVGRPITQANDPVAAYTRCKAEFVD